jgi:hypothetical protein
VIGVKSAMYSTVLPWTAGIEVITGICDGGSPSSASSELPNSGKRSVRPKLSDISEIELGPL